MKKAFGKPKGRMARVREGRPVFRARVSKANLPVLKEALRRARLKMSGSFVINIRDISNDAVNLARSVLGRKMKKREEAKPVVAAVAVAEGEAAPGKEGDAKAEGKAEGKGEKAAAPSKEEKPAKKK